MFACGQSRGETCRVWEAMHVLEMRESVEKVREDKFLKQRRGFVFCRASAKTANASFHCVPSAKAAVKAP